MIWIYNIKKKKRKTVRENMFKMTDKNYTPKIFGNVQISFKWYRTSQPSSCREQQVHPRNPSLSGTRSRNSSALECEQEKAVDMAQSFGGSRIRSLWLLVGSSVPKPGPYDGH
jgi:hypothetical protein